MACVYRHIRKDTNDVFYIGIGTTEKRINSKLSRNPLWVNITKKTEYISEIIEDGLSWKDACIREKYWISYYGRRDVGKGTLVNMTDGGDGFSGLVKTEDHKRKISQSKRGLSFSETHKENLKRARKQIMTDEFRREIGIRSKNISLDTKLKMSESAKNRIRNVVECIYCGKSVSDTHLTQHQRGKLCIEKQKTNKKS